MELKLDCLGLMETVIEQSQTLEEIQRDRDLRDFETRALETCYKICDFLDHAEEDEDLVLKLQKKESIISESVKWTDKAENLFQQLETSFSGKVKEVLDYTQEVILRIIDWLKQRVPA